MPRMRAPTSTRTPWLGSLPPAGPAAITGQADFAQIQIDYQPGARCLETKSLKFYLASYRNERSFNEVVTNQILDDLVEACAPRRMIVQAEFVSRGGISLTIRAIHPDLDDDEA